MPGIGHGIGIPFARKGFQWSTYWATLISATIEDANPNYVILTFPTPAISLLATDFSVTIDGYSSTISGIAWVGGVLQITIADNVVYGDTVIVTFGKTGETVAVTNNTLADFYVRSDGSNTSPYDTPAKGATSIATVMTYIKNNGDGSGSVVSVGVGTFGASNIYFESANQDNVQIVGVSQDDTIVTLTAGNNRLVYHNLGDNVFIKRMTLYNVGTDSNRNTYYGANNGKTLTMVNVTLKATSAHSAFHVYSIGNHIKFKGVRIYSQGVSTTNNYTVYLRNGANGTFEYVTLNSAVGSPRALGGFALSTTGNVLFDHCNILDCYASGIYQYGLGSTVIKNSIVQGNCSRDSSYYPISRTNGSLTVSNTLVISDVYDAASRFINGTYTDGGGNILINSNPKFKNYARKGYILPRVDDYGKREYAENLSTLMAARGFSATFCFQSYSYSALHLSSFVNMVESGGMQVAAHGYSHSACNCTGKLFDVTKGAETITISRTTDTITLSGGGSVTGFKAKTLAAIVTELEGLGCTVTPSAIYGGDDDQVHPTCIGEAFDDGVAVNQIDLLIDNTGATGYLYVEVAKPKADITAAINAGGNITDPQTGATFECRSMEAPYGKSSLDCRLAAIASGYASFSSGDQLGVGAINTIVYLDLYAIPGIGSGSLTGLSESVIRASARAYAFAAAQTGMVIMMVDHGSMSDAEWGYVLDEWEAFGDDIKVCSMQQYADDIRGGDWVDGGDGTFTRTFADDADYELEDDSPLIGQADDGGNIGAY